MDAPTWLWIGFAALVGTVMLVDLGLLQKKAHAVSMKEAGSWCLLWFSLAMAFAGVIWKVSGSEKALMFAAGYLLELSLSVDNMFVFIMIFTYFKVSREHQPRVLHWGILGAIVMRLVFIFLGVELIQRFHWMIYAFGALLVFTGAKMALQKDEDQVDPRQSLILKLFRKLMPMTDEDRGQDFFYHTKGAWHATPLFATLLVVEFSDVIFAIDSIPAVLAITQDRFIVYTSNIFAIMGLRALYFLLAGMAAKFEYLKLGISLILVFVGVKMLASRVYHIPVGLSLGIIAAVLGISIAASLLASRRRTMRESAGRLDGSAPRHKAGV